MPATRTSSSSTTRTNGSNANTTIAMRTRNATIRDWEKNVLSLCSSPRIVDGIHIMHSLRVRLSKTISRHWRYSRGLLSERTRTRSNSKSCKNGCYNRGSFLDTWIFKGTEMDQIWNSKMKRLLWNRKWIKSFVQTMDSNISTARKAMLFTTSNPPTLRCFDTTYSGERDTFTSGTAAVDKRKQQKKTKTTPPTASTTDTYIPDPRSSPTPRTQDSVSSFTPLHWIIHWPISNMSLNAEVLLVGTSHGTRYTWIGMRWASGIQTPNIEIWTASYL